jgi:hypothetical protein
MMWHELSVAPRALCDDISGASGTEEWRRSDMAAELRSLADEVIE